MHRTSGAAAWILCGLLCVSSPIRGEEVTSKDQLARELIEVSGGGAMAQQMTDMMLASIRANYASMVEQLIASQPDLDAEERAAITQRLASFDRFASTFASRVSERVDFEQILTEIYVPLYVQHFSAAELREILEFQTSPVGRKANSVMPRLLQDGMEATAARLQPIVLDLVSGILAEEQAVALGQAP